ncbi:class I SAM-dependent methyltransferase [Reinekea sp.]|jgi:2-polyprenyl-3-methyl-5-hydroxy-6-metoxy-1,4-benzoquinol methylase|uniref:class I SAM-dependent methyltransferase n=1 Tax=Reinekea sp. TaxID=1970455 RepID=UPI00398A328F
MTKPDHLSKEIGDQFGDSSIVDHYGYRPNYTAEVIDYLSHCLKIHAMSVLDIGSGTGEISIPLSKQGHCVVGVDPSKAMVKAAVAKGSKVSFVNAYIEQFESDVTFDLIVAANSIHWADWDKTFPLLKGLSKPQTKMAIVTGGDLIVDTINSEVIQLIQAYSTTKNFKPYSVVTILEDAGHIKNTVTQTMPIVEVTQKTTEYIASYHARNGFSVERMGEKLAKEFDNKLESLLQANGFPETVTGTVTFCVTLADIN